jgi:hypothetical protein
MGLITVMKTVRQQEGNKFFPPFAMAVAPIFLARLWSKCDILYGFHFKKHSGTLFCSEHILPNAL